jgi:hypothetical protein
MRLGRSSNALLARSAGREVVIAGDLGFRQSSEPRETTVVETL